MIAAVVDLQVGTARVGVPAVVAGDQVGLALEVAGQVDDGDRALEIVGVARLAEGRLAHRAVALGVEHEGRAAVVAQGDGRGEVTGVAEAADRAGVEVDLGDGVVAAVGHVEGLAPDRQGVGHAAEHAERSPPQGDRPGHLAGVEVDLGDRVAHGVGDVGPPARDDDRRGMDADLDVAGCSRLAGRSG